MNALYAILFSNQTLKVGKTSNLATRISQHRGAAKSMGQEIIQMWITPYPVDDLDSAERDLINCASKKFSKITSEFFSCESESAACTAIGLAKEKLIKCESVFTKNGKLMIEINSDKKPKTSKIDSEKLLNTIKSFGESGVTEGIIKNRHRNLSHDTIEQILKCLTESHCISLLIKGHPKNNTKTNWYFTLDRC